MGVCSTLTIVTAVLVHPVTLSQMISKRYSTSAVALGAFWVMTSLGSSVRDSAGLDLFTKPGWLLPALTLLA